MSLAHLLLRGVPALQLLPVQVPAVPDLFPDAKLLRSLAGDVDAELAIASQATDAVVRLRDAVALPTLPTLPSLPPVFAIDELRDLLNDLLLDLRTVAVLALGSSFLLAVCCGVLFGDNSSPLDELGRGKGQETTRPTGAERTFLASRFSSARARDYDRGVDAPPPSGERRAASAPQRSERAPPVSAAMWFELALCVAVDACGSASLYFPAFGEVSDAGFAVLNAFVIELLFDWPELAAFAFWEELLPFSDFLPTATIGWALVVTGTRTRLTRADWNSLKPPPPKPPLADLRSYEPFGGEDSAHLRPGSTPWE